MLEAIADALAELRDTYAATLDDDTRDAYEHEFDRAAKRRFRSLTGGRLMLIEDYGLIGDLQTAALVGRDGSIDWLCFPRFDSGACFAALLGNEEQRPLAARARLPVERVERRYAKRLARARDRLPHRARQRARDRLHAARGAADPDVVRIVEGLEGSVPMRMELVLRFDYGSIVPWVRRLEDDTRIARRRPGRGRVPHAGAAARREPEHRRRVHGRSRASACRSC